MNNVVDRRWADVHNAVGFEVRNEVRRRVWEYRRHFLPNPGQRKLDGACRS